MSLTNSRRSLAIALVLTSSLFAVEQRAYSQPAQPPAPPQPAASAAPASSAPIGPGAPRTDPTLERLARIRPMPGGWTAETAATKARATSLDIVAKQEALRAAAAKVDQTLVGFFPRVQLVGKYTRYQDLSSGSGSGFSLLVPAGPVQNGVPIPPNTPLVPVSFSFPIPLNQYYFAATLTIPISDYFLRISHNYASASHNEEAARHDKVASEVKAAADARVAFYQWVKAMGSREVLAQALIAAQEHQRDAEALFKAGQASKADVLGVESQVASGKLALAQADEYVKLSEEQLRTMTHIAPEEQITLGEDVAEVVPPMALDIAALKQEAMANRPELKAIAAAEHSLEKTQTTIRAAQLPNVQAFGDAVYANPNPRVFPQEEKFRFNWDVGLQVAWSPNDLFTGGAAASEIEANVARLRAQRAALRDGVGLEVTQAALSLKTAETNAETSIASVIAAEEAYRVRKELYRVGRATSVELSDAETNLFRAKLVAVAARIDQRIARVRVEHASGRDAVKVERAR